MCFDVGDYLLKPPPVNTDQSALDRTEWNLHERPKRCQRKQPSAMHQLLVEERSRRLSTAVYAVSEVPSKNNHPFPSLSLPRRKCVCVCACLRVFLFPSPSIRDHRSLVRPTKKGYEFHNIAYAHAFESKPARWPPSQPRPVTTRDDLNVSPCGSSFFVVVPLLRSANPLASRKASTHSSKERRLSEWQMKRKKNRSSMFQGQESLLRPAYNSTQKKGKGECEWGCWEKQQSVKRVTTRPGGKGIVAIII